MSSEPKLSLILCTRNDAYMGNSRWRLETVLNQTAKNIAELSLAERVEIIVADWGSDQPLHDVLRLGEATRELVRFCTIPPQTATTLQQDSPFPEVLALNAAFVRSNGDYVGRIDNDTIVGRMFLRKFFELIDGPADGRSDGFDPSRSFMFTHRRCVPFSFASRSPSARAVEWLLRYVGPMLPTERINAPNKFFQSPVGIMVMHSDLWIECGGYDQKLLYWGWMECDLGFRLMQRYPAIDLGKRIGRSLFHLEHYSPAARTVARRMNPMRRDNVFHPNADGWGLSTEHLPLQSASLPPTESRPANSIIHDLRNLLRAVLPLPRLQLKWLMRDWPFSMILFEPKTGHLRRRFRPRPNQTTDQNLNQKPVQKPVDGDTASRPATPNPATRKAA